MREPLPEILPTDPLPLLAQWLEEAGPVVKAPTAMALATVDADGRPTVRMVICRGFDVDLGWFVFYSDRESAKGRALAANPRAAVVFHWDVFERQIRVEGPVTHAPDADSDRYWRTRPLDARVAAAASDQSRPIASRRRRGGAPAQALGRLPGVGRAGGAVGGAAGPRPRSGGVDADPAARGGGLHRRLVAGDAASALRGREALRSVSPWARCAVLGHRRRGKKGARSP